MKIVHAFLPVVAALDAESSVHNLMEAASARNVTQMESLMQALVQETIQGDGVEQLEEDIKKALYVIRGNLVAAIRTSLTTEHKVDQDFIMEQLKCFDKCKDEKNTDEKACESYDKTSLKLEKSHVNCRSSLMTQYAKKIDSCNALDDWVAAFRLTAKPVEACVYDAQYKCHYRQCAEGEDSSQCTPAIDGIFGEWLQTIITEASAGYDTWLRMHKSCKAHYHAYIQLDSSCDVKQGDFEMSFCNARQCRYSACNVNYHACRDRCIVEYHRTVKRVECAEKDRKIDWAASEKIECYLRILLASPTNEELQANCEDKMRCLNEWRTKEYEKCEKVCPHVDYNSKNGYSQHERRDSVHGDPLDHTKQLHNGRQHVRQYADNAVEGDTTWGVNTTHRVDDKKDSAVEKRCTQHLDIDFQPIPCAAECPPPRPSPCDEVFVAKYYHWFLQITQIEQLSDARRCHTDAPGEHTEKWGYNLCDCRECTPCVGTPHNRDDDYCETPSFTCPEIVTGDGCHGAGGDDYKQVMLSSAEQCQLLCTYESKCISWAYEGYMSITVVGQEPTGKCWLKAGAAGVGTPEGYGGGALSAGAPCDYGPVRVPNGPLTPIAIPTVEQDVKRARMSI